MKSIIQRLKSIYSYFFKTEKQLTEVKLKGLYIGENTQNNANINIKCPHKSTIRIGDDCLIYGNIYTETEEATITIGNNVFIGNSTIFSVVEVIIEDDVLISSDCLIQDTDNHSMSRKVRKKDCNDWKTHAMQQWEFVEKKPIR